MYKHPQHQLLKVFTAVVVLRLLRAAALLFADAADLSSASSFREGHRHRHRPAMDTRVAREVGEVRAGPEGLTETCGGRNGPGRTPDPEPPRPGSPGSPSGGTVLSSSVGVGVGVAGSPSKGWLRSEVLLGRVGGSVPPTPSRPSRGPGSRGAGAGSLVEEQKGP